VGVLLTAHAVLELNCILSVSCEQRTGCPGSCPSRTAIGPDLFGGHFLNRRLDRVVLVGTLLGAAVGVTALVFVANSFDGGFESAFTTGVLNGLAVFVASIVLLSTGFTFRDARQPRGGPLTITMRVIGALLSLFGALILLVSASLVVVRYAPVSDMSAERLPLAGEIGGSSEGP